MTTWLLIWRSLRFHARSHLGALLGAAVGSAVLTGALLVGDSVRESLRELALARLGKTEFALASQDRLFRDHLAEEIAATLRTNNGGSASVAATVRGAGPVEVAAALQLPGTVVTGDGTARANRVQVLGVDEQFWKLAQAAPSFTAIPADAVALNQALAEHLKVKVGDAVLVRVPKPSQFSRDAPLSPEEDTSTALRLRVHAIVSDEQFGRFGLASSQAAPFNAFLSRAELQTKAGVPERANLLLVGGGRATLSEAAAALRQDFQLADAQAELRAWPDAQVVELRTSRVFLDAPLAEAARKISPRAKPLLTYFANELRVGDRATPYSMVTAMGGPVVPAGMRDDEILLNQWLADDLQAKPGDELKLTYYVVGLMHKLEEQSQVFRVRGVVPMSGPSADRTLMPDFPGLANAKSCREWDAGFPIHLDRIRDQDQKYWDVYRGTPKAFVTLAAGQKMWSNRFGDLTAVRYPASELTASAAAEALRRALDPASVGLVFQPVRAEAITASEQAQDFGQLFLGFSFFLIIAALLLMSLLFRFAIEQRTTEVGILLALGFTPKRVRRLLLGESGVVALVGGVAGMLGGVGYAQAILYGLSTLWRGAVGTSALRYHAAPVTLLTGAFAGTVIAWLTLAVALRKQAAQPARELLSEGAEEAALRQDQSGHKSSLSRWLAVGATVGGLALTAWGIAAPGAGDEGAFFGAGALLLIAGLAGASLFLGRLARTEAAARLTLTGMGLRNSARRRKRSLTTLGLLACGSFLVIAVAANRLDASKGVTLRSSGSGGFALIGEATLPVVQDLNSPAGRDFFGLDAAAMNGARLVPLRAHDGEDASCLNLNRARRPRLLGVDPAALDERGAFTFSQVAPGLAKDHPWRALDQPVTDDAIPAVGDEATIVWALGKRIGDTLDYTDEHGRAFKLRLVGAVANSILQGNLLIAEKQFISRYPSEGGYRMFLIDAPSDKVVKLSQTLTRALQDDGLELTPAATRLAAFNAVENTYLDTFQVLGGLGLLLGSAGLGVVVLRNVFERRGELALLLAVGFKPRSLKWLVASEHGALLAVGLGIGVVAALVAALPALLSPGAQVPFAALAATLGAVLLSGVIWTYAATAVALRAKLLDALRND